MFHVLGAGGHAKVIIDILKKNGEKNIFVFDDNEYKIEKGKVLGAEIKGSIKGYNEIDKDINLIIGIGDNKTRKEIA